MISCTKRLRFSAGHRIFGHESKCELLHGHNYRVEITATTDELDPQGRVVDFGVIKKWVGEWIDEHWDHRFLLYQDDPMLASAPPETGVIRVPFNPSAENLAQHLYGIAKSLLEGTGVRVARVRVWETETCWADYSP